MLYEISVDVETNSYVQSPYEIEVHPYIVKIECDDDGKVNRITVQIRVANYEEYLPVMYKEDDETYVLDAKLNINPHYHNIIRLFQHIEALGGYLFRLTKVHWNKPTEKWIWENPEEREKLNVLVFPHPEPYYPEFTTSMNPKLLALMIEEREKYTDLLIPLSFFREGKNEFKTFRYVSAFYNYYFFLEDMFGEGKTKNYQVEKSFKNSQQLIKAIEITLDEYGKDPKLEKKLQNLLSENGDKRDVEGLINLIVRMRGELHHFSQKSSRRKAHPLNQNEFEPIAYLMMTICEYILALVISSRSPEFYLYLS